MDLKKELNKKQHEAVTSDAQYLRIIAGAGSGKTRVLTYRIVHLIENLGVPSERILGITFTNKAATEMKERVVKLLPFVNPRMIKLSTFHAFCARFLREEISYFSGYSSTFIIYDEDDQKRLVKDVAVARGHEKRDEIIKVARDYISQHKASGKTPEDINIKFERFIGEKEALAIWKDYESRKVAMNALDFDDLMNKALVILTESATIRKKWQARFDHILVDEFQDTNDIQFLLINKLMAKTTSLYVVGDPDQTIYTWRGANDEIMLGLDKKFKVETVILNENYRSTQSILNAANKLIVNNSNRIKKDLFTSNSLGDEVELYCADDSPKEANWIVQKIISMKAASRDFSYRDVVILIRANYLSLNFEKEFMRMQIPYQIFGGFKFFQRKEIKDVLAYFRLLMTDKDDISFGRIANTPRRGMSTSLDALKVYALKNDYSLIEAVRFGDEPPLSARSKDFLNLLISHIDQAREQLQLGERDLGGILEEYIIGTGLIEFFKEEKDEDKRETIQDNIQTLFEDIDDFVKKNPESNFADYLENTALMSASDEVANVEKVTLMTVHMAKGLEYDFVFVAGLNQGVFPNQRALDEGGEKALEEERRLCYVAFTRAKKSLFLTYNLGYSPILRRESSPSKFLEDAGFAAKIKRYSNNLPNKNFISKYHVDDDDGYAPDVIYETNDTANDWQVGDKVRHSFFGDGKVAAVQKLSKSIDIYFASVGIKRISSAFKGLSKINMEDMS